MGLQVPFTPYLLVFLLFFFFHFIPFINPFTPGDFAEKHILKLVEWFSDHCRAIKS